MLWTIGGLVVVLLWAVVTPNLLRSRMAADDSARFSQRHTLEWQMPSNSYGAALVKAKPVAVMQVTDAGVKVTATPGIGADATAGWINFWSPETGNRERTSRA